MTRIVGGCLCGAVRYDFDAEPQLTAVCHCENCQRQTGTSFSIIIAVGEDVVKFKRQESLKAFDDIGASGQPVHRHFCGDCGSPIMSIVESTPGLAYIKAGTLDDRSWLTPTIHIWCETAQPWVPIPEGAVKAARNT